MVRCEELWELIGLRTAPVRLRPCREEKVSLEVLRYVGRGSCWLGRMIRSSTSQSAKASGQLASTAVLIACAMLLGGADAAAAALAIAFSNLPRTYGLKLRPA